MTVHSVGSYIIDQLLLIFPRSVCLPSPVRLSTTWWGETVRINKTLVSAHIWIHCVWRGPLISEIYVSEFCRTSPRWIKKTLESAYVWVLRVRLASLTCSGEDCCRKTCSSTQLAAVQHTHTHPCTHAPTHTRTHAHTRTHTHTHNGRGCQKKQHRKICTPKPQE